MFENREASGSISKWATQLAEHTIDFISRSAIKSQVLADFIADWTPATPSQENPKIETIWQLECDGAYQRDGAGASAVLTAPSGTQLKYAVILASLGAAVSAALVEERMVEGALTQAPIYFVSEALNGSKLLYSEMEKMAYAVVTAARKLRYYFQSHKIKVPTSFPLRDMFENREASGRIGKWATQLAEHTIDFVSRSAIKSQVLAY